MSNNWNNNNPNYLYMNNNNDQNNMMINYLNFIQNANAFNRNNNNNFINSNFNFNNNNNKFLFNSNFNNNFRNFINNNNNSNNNSNNNKNEKKKKNKQDFNNQNESSNLSISNLLNLNDNELFSLIINQKGSREIQNLLIKFTIDEITKLILKLKLYFNQIFIDKYGNYFIQKLIQISNIQQRISILNLIQKNFVDIANNSFGTHPLQNLIEIISSKEEKKLLLDFILNNETALALDSQGTHVLQKFISITNDEERINLNLNLIKHLDILINDAFGCCVIIKLIKHTNDMKIKEFIINYISKNNPLNFIQHPFANYVVQCFFNQIDIVYCDIIINSILENFFILSTKKYSSNVVENCIKFGKEDVVKKIYNEIISNNKLGFLLNNTYGNFVIEKLLARLNKSEKEVIIKEIEKLGKEKTLSITILNLLYK
jgi:hypothetical protein